MAKDDIFQVTTTFVITLGDRDVEYHAGELVDSDDPAYKRVPEHFGPVEFKHRKAEKPEHAKENAGGAFVLPKEEVEALDAAFPMRPGLRFL